MALAPCALLRQALLALAETRLHCLTAEYGILGMSRAPLPLLLLELHPGISILLSSVSFSATKRLFLCQASANTTLDRSTNHS
jgi:hypothetical protein